MGFLDSILAPFGYGDPIGKAAAAKTAGINAGLGKLDQSYGAGRDVLSTDYSAALDFLKGQYGAAGNTLNDFYTKALDPYKALAPTATGGYQAYADASGANGPEGLARARSAYGEGSPGLQTAIDRSVNDITRAGNARGIAAGNTIDQSGEIAQRLRLGDWGDYVQRLAPWLQEGGRVAGAQSDLASKFGFGQAGLATDLGKLGSQGQMDLAKLLGSSYFGQGDVQLGAQTDIGNANASAALGPAQYGQNIWGLGMNLAKNLPGLGNIGSSLFSGITGKKSLFGIPGQG